MYGAVRTGIGAVCVEYGRPKWPITMLNHTQIHTELSFVFLFLAPYARTTRYEIVFFPFENQRKKRLASLERLMIIVHKWRDFVLLWCLV